MALQNFEKYEEATRGRNWEEICKINEVSYDSFGTLKEMGVLHEYLEEGEVVVAITSGLMGQGDTSNSIDLGWNTWLLALTNERFLLLDHALMTKSVDTQSIRLDRVQGVSASQGWMFGKVAIDIGNRMIVVDNCFKASVKIIAELANKLIKDQASPPRTATPLSPSQRTPVEELKDLAEMKAAGILTEEEFSEVKKSILAKF